ncbi:hypothetical protein OH77DRAFT_1413248, partial [Trametes cingulata]
MVHSVIEQYTLNTEQSRAFSIAARHLHHHTEGADCLRMFLGGMAGTGKSRVILSIMGFLVARGERHRFLILGPTGASAALLGGSTYHSMLGIGFEKDGGSKPPSSEVIRERFQGVDMIFLDEASMLDCVSMDTIKS